MIRKAWKRAILGLLLTALPIGGCLREGSGDTEGAEERPAEEEIVRLTMWGGVPPEAGPEAVVEAWNREHPRIQVEYVRYVNDDDGNLMLDTALLTGQRVDLYVSYTRSQAAKRVEAGLALDLSEFKDEYDPDSKMGEDAAAWKIDGRYYGIPTKKNVYFVAMNKDALDRAGLPVPTSWTWGELRSYAKKLSETHRYGFLQHMETFADPIDSVLFREGEVDAAGESNLDHPQVSQWLETLQAMMEQDRSTPAYGEQLTSKMPVEHMFLSGEAAMLNIGEWLIRSANQTPDPDFRIAFAPVPRLPSDAADFATRGGLGDFVSIHPKSAHPEAAWAFLRWYADGGMLPMAAGGRLPASKDVEIETAMRNLLGGREDRYDVASLKYVMYVDPTPTFVRSVAQQVIGLRTEEYERFFLGEQSLEHTLRHMANRHERFLRERGDPQ